MVFDPPRLPMCNYRCNRSPLFAKNSRLGYFLDAKSPQGESYDTERFETIANKKVPGYFFL